MDAIDRNHQETRMHHFRTTTTFFTDHSPATTSWPTSHQDWNWLVDATLLFYRDLSHVKSKIEKSMSQVYHLLSSIQLLAYMQ